MAMTIKELIELKELLSSDTISTVRLTTNDNFRKLRNGLIALIDTLQVDGGPNVVVDTVEASDIVANSFATPLPRNGVYNFRVNSNGEIYAKSAYLNTSVHTPRLRMEPDPTTTAFQAGEIRWSGTDWLGWNGTTWVSLSAGAPLPITAGPLVINQIYTIESYFAGDDFTNVGAASNANGVTFVATGTTPAVWTNGSILSSNQGEANTMANIGAGEGIYDSKTGVQFQMKSLSGVSGITVDGTGPTILISGGGLSGFSGFSGGSGVSGISGGSGTSGYSGISGYSGTGASGVSGFSGTGVSGFSGVSGRSGFSGFSGVGGSGYSGQSGKSGFSGFSGVSGFSGKSGYSGQPGAAGASGFSGDNGASGASGFSGESGFSGVSGFSGNNGTSGFSGFSGFLGQSGFSGVSGFSGFSGTSGLSGTSGESGFSGVSGFSGFSGYSGETLWELDLGDIVTTSVGSPNVYTVRPRFDEMQNLGATNFKWDNFYVNNILNSVNSISVIAANGVYLSDEDDDHFLDIDDANSRIRLYSIGKITANGFNSELMLDNNTSWIYTSGNTDGINSGIYTDTKGVILNEDFTTAFNNKVTIYADNGHVWIKKGSPFYIPVDDLGIVLSTDLAGHITLCSGDTKVVATNNISYNIFSVKDNTETVNFLVIDGNGVMTLTELAEYTGANTDIADIDAGVAKTLVTKEWVQDKTGSKYVEEFLPVTVGSPNTITHMLGTEDLVVQLWHNGKQIEADTIEVIDQDTIEVTFTGSNPNEVSPALVKVTIIGL